MNDLLHIKDLQVSSLSDSKILLSATQLQVQQGEIYGLVGESGAGKSTIGKVILNALPAGLQIDKGEFWYKNNDLIANGGLYKNIIGKKISLIPQNPMNSLNPFYKIGTQLRSALLIKDGVNKKILKDYIFHMLESVFIKDPARVLKSYPHELSGGMKQRILIASVFAMEPELIVADEPTTALDVTVQKQILKLIKKLQAEHNTSIIFITHDLGVVAKICDSMSVLYHGKIIETGTVEETFHNPQQAYTKALLRATPDHKSEYNPLSSNNTDLLTQLDIGLPE